MHARLELAVRYQHDSEPEKAESQLEFLVYLLWVGLLIVLLRVVF